jgi:hypothetical protein
MGSLAKLWAQVGLFQEQWQAGRIFSLTVARILTIGGKEPLLALCPQQRHFHFFITLEPTFLLSHHQ